MSRKLDLEQSGQSYSPTKQNITTEEVPTKITPVKNKPQAKTQQAKKKTVANKKKNDEAAAKANGVDAFTCDFDDFFAARTEIAEKKDTVKETSISASTKITTTGGRKRKLKDVQKMEVQMTDVVDEMKEPSPIKAASKG